ncbi:hypothetical protein [Legionella jamestowniensis]|uniref:Uncharacterized protein n=1 Tax=Legionella jamestowniensis TaxID=455 RepID=A0A0W0UWJ7_9GAMM|nr:hypothetical protein [Legionella jamestowniensis]KTD12203.1 hypothetical protein Ljam_0318 [Legionella jamestowniensis]OCH96812.1 hypothetical protein A8135_04000 [Legionella jamestowniensis]SFM02848.1 hypothetical protein SAMN02746073_0007 [Legionella jamestowniensis DSM 19215]
MKGQYHGIEFEYSSQPINGKYAGEYLLIFHHEQYTYIIKKSVGKMFATPREAEIKAMEFAKNQIERGLF